MFHLLHMSRSSRCIICTVHDYSSDTILHICALERHHLKSWIDQVAVLRTDPGRRSPLGLHISLLQLAYEGSHADIWDVRCRLLTYVCFPQCFGFGGLVFPLLTHGTRKTGEMNTPQTLRAEGNGLPRFMTWPRGIILPRKI
jgi:hypothetical protein